MSGKLIHSIFQHIRSMLKWRIEEHSQRPADLNSYVPVAEEEELVKEMKQINHGHESIVAEMQLVETSAARSATLATSTSELANVNMVASSMHDFLAMGELGGPSLPPLPLMQSESDAPAYTLDRQTCQKRLEDGGQETGNDSKTQILLIEREQYSASFPEVDLQKGMDVPERSSNEVSKEDEQSCYNFIYRDNLRQDLYTFYEPLKANVNNLGALPSITSFQENGRSSPFKSFTADAAKVFVRSELLHHTGYAMELLSKLNVI